MSRMSRRVLIACYYFPPVPSVGSVRVGALARRLPDHGWEPVVVTVRHPDRKETVCHVVETGDADVAASLKRRVGMKSDLAMRDLVSADAVSPSKTRRMKRFVIEAGKALFAFPDSNRGWVKHAVRAALAAHSEKPFDAVLTSSPPVSAHLAGRRINEITGAPWVADLRDLWSQDHNSTAPPWRKRLDRGIEMKTFGKAGALVTVSDPLREQLSSLHPGIPTHTIRNGFDPDLLSLSSPPAGIFTITHTGTFYQGRRDPVPFFEALSSLLGRGVVDRRRLRVRLLSREEPWLPALVDRFGLAGVVELVPWTPWEDALRAQQESHVLLLLHWGGEAEAGVYTGKIFEYLAARRPILMAGGGRGVLADLLRETGSGVHARDREAIEKHLLEWWEEFDRTGSVTFTGNDSTLEQYSHHRMAREFAAVLDETCSRRKQR